MYVSWHEEGVDAAVQWPKGRVGDPEDLTSLARACCTWVGDSSPGGVSHTQASHLRTCPSRPPAQPAWMLSEASGLGCSPQLCVCRACVSFLLCSFYIILLCPLTSPASQATVTHKHKRCSLFPLFLGVSRFPSLSPLG